MAADEAAGGNAGNSGRLERTGGFTLTSTGRRPAEIALGTGRRRHVENGSRSGVERDLTLHLCWRLRKGVAPHGIHEILQKHCRRRADIFLVAAAVTFKCGGHRASAGDMLMPDDIRALVDSIYDSPR